MFLTTKANHDDKGNRKKTESARIASLKVVHVNAAGVDISPKEMQVCVPSDRAEKCNRTFGVYTKT